MTVTCDHIRAAFGHFECCGLCHHPLPHDNAGILCCAARLVMSDNRVDQQAPETHSKIALVLEKLK